MKLRYTGLSSKGCLYGKVYECEVHYTPSGFMQVFPQGSSKPMQYHSEQMFLQYWEPVNSKEEKDMLEFEDVNPAPQAPQQPREAQGVLECVAAPQQPVVNAAGPGYVLVPLETYNELLVKANAASRAIRFERRTYGLNDTLEVCVDNRWLYEQAMQGIYKWFSPDMLAQFDLVPSADKLFAISTTIGRVKDKLDTDVVKVDKLEIKLTPRPDVGSTDDAVPDASKKAADAIAYVDQLLADGVSNDDESISDNLE